ncbi:MAG: glycosyltransferase [Thermoguttaceae bacterium]
MHDVRISKCDLHVHSKYSDRPSEWFLRRMGTPESFVEPREIYRNARQKGMDFVTISDHNCIRGALEIAHLPGTFISNEVTTYFPENDSKVHILVTGINEEQFRMIQELRADIYRLQEYLMGENIVCSVAHVLFRVNGRLTIDQFERLLLLFPRFELINGSRDRRAADLVGAVLGSLTPEMISAMAERQGIEPYGPQPWKKVLTAGSDDHSGAYTAMAFTKTPLAATVDEYLAFLRRGEHEADGACGGSVLMGHAFYQIASDYYQDRFVRGNKSDKPTLVGQLFELLLKTPSREGSGWSLKGFATRFFVSRQLSKLSETERQLVADFGRLFSDQHEEHTAQLLMDDRRTFRIACHISQTLGYNFLKRFIEFAKQGKLMESLQTVASLAPVALSMAPYLAAFSTQHKDEHFHKAIAAHFPSAAHLRRASDHKAWITDTFAEVNGVSRTIQVLAETARKTGRKLVVLTSMATTPAIENLSENPIGPDGNGAVSQGSRIGSKIDRKNFQPVGTFPLPEYESQMLAFPPFLEMFEYIERHRFNELIISTPGPMGLTGLAAARLLGLRTTGIYHTDFVQYVRHLTQDDDLAGLTWQYMRWFYEQCTTILVPTEIYRRQLIDNGFEPSRLGIMARGVDNQLFHPSKATPTFFDRYGQANRFHFLYVGRISKEKNVDALIDGFDEVLRRGYQASLVFVGDGPHRQRLAARCQDRPVAFTGILEGEELARAYASGDCLVFPSTTDTFGNVVLEAQASGLPVVVTDQGGPAEIVRRHDSGIVVDLSQPQTLADAMEKIILDADLRRELSERGLRNAAERKWENVLEEFWSRNESDCGELDMETYRSLDTRSALGAIAMVVD